MATFTTDFAAGIGPEWTTPNWGAVLVAVSGGVGATANPFNDASMWCQQAATADHTATVRLSGSQRNYQLAVRASSGDAWRYSSGTGTAYFFELSSVGGTGTLYRATNGAWTSLGTWNDSGYTSGQTASLQADGSTITVRRNGTQVLQVTDATITTGTITGIKATMDNLSVATFDDFSVSDKVVAPSRWKRLRFPAKVGSPSAVSLGIANENAATVVELWTFPPGAAGSASVTAPVATVSASAPAPTVTGGAAVTAPAATVTATAPASTVGISATVAAPVAAASVTALAPTVTSGAQVAAPAATATTTALAPTVRGGTTTAIPAATVNTTATAPTVRGGAAVAATAATVTAAGPAPTVTGGAIVTAVAATVTAAAPSPAVGTGATITAVVATVTVAAPAPSVSAASGSGVSAPAATVSVTALAPTVVGIRNASTTAPAATITAEALAPTVLGIRAAVIAAVAALVDAAALAPTVTITPATTPGQVGGTQRAAALTGATTTTPMTGTQHSARHVSGGTAGTSVAGSTATATITRS